MRESNSEINDKKIAFILCVNNEEYLKESEHYIQQLEVPEGYGTDVIIIRDADSMCAAYNLAMKSTDAKYKIYLHQDVYLLKRDLLACMLDIFKDETIGLIGTVGTRKLPRNARAAQAWDCGNVLLYNGDSLFHMKSFDRTQMSQPQVMDVEAIDGMLMMTQYDLLWDDRSFDAFHFYDISQCMEFAFAGYRIVLPVDEDVWALHDSGISGERGYDDYRKKFCEKYADRGFHYDAADDGSYSLVGAEIERQKHCLMEHADSGVNQRLVEETQAFLGNGYLDSDVMCLCHYLEIIDLEIKNAGNSQTGRTSWRQYQNTEWKLRLLCWRAEYLQEAAAAEAFLQQIVTGQVTMECAEIIVGHCVLNAADTWGRLKEYVEPGRSQ